MRHPTYIEMPTRIAHALNRTVVDEPFTEVLIELFGRFWADRITVYNHQPILRPEGNRTEVNYGNWSAKARSDSYQDALDVSGDISVVKSERIGQAHSHIGRPYKYTPSRDDFMANRDRMDEYKMDQWLELILCTSQVNINGGVKGVYFSRVNGRPNFVVSNTDLQLRGGLRTPELEIRYVGHYIYKNGERLRRRELPIVLEKRAKVHFNAHQPADMTAVRSFRPS